MRYIKSHTSRLATSSPRTRGLATRELHLPLWADGPSPRPLQLALVSRWLQRGRKARCRSLASLNVLTPATVTVGTQKYLIVEKKYLIFEKTILCHGAKSDRGADCGHEPLQAKEQVRCQGKCQDSGQCPAKCQDNCADKSPGGRSQVQGLAKTVAGHRVQEAPQELLLLPRPPAGLLLLPRPPAGLLLLLGARSRYVVSCIIITLLMWPLLGVTGHRVNIPRTV